jgi:hypothetical protein
MEMNRVSLDIANCYGIKKLEYTFDLSQSCVYAIYAPNGVMKSSLAQTFQDIANGTPSSDRIFPQRASVRMITDENDQALAAESIFVVRPYDEALATPLSSILVLFIMTGLKMRP